MDYPYTSIIGTALIKRFVNQRSTLGFICHSAKTRRLAVSFRGVAIRG
jgi:hypothetical protein